MSGTVLVVDDDIGILEMLEDVLGAEGYRVATAVNGRAALDVIGELVARARPPCVVLLDLMMPVMDGAEVLQHLRSDPATRGLEVIVISAWDAAIHDLPHEVKRLRKPLELDELLDEVHSRCSPS
jgi:CheY-like chemotaxis protein